MTSLGFLCDVTEFARGVGGSLCDVTGSLRDASRVKASIGSSVLFVCLFFRLLVIGFRALLHSACAGEFELSELSFAKKKLFLAFILLGEQTSSFVAEGKLLDEDGREGRTQPKEKEVLGPTSSFQVIFGTDGTAVLEGEAGIRRNSICLFSLPSASKALQVGVRNINNNLTVYVIAKQ